MVLKQNPGFGQAGDLVIVSLSLNVQVTCKSTFKLLTILARITAKNNESWKESGGLIK